MNDDNKDNYIEMLKEAERLDKSLKQRKKTTTNKEGDIELAENEDFEEIISGQFKDETILDEELKQEQKEKKVNALEEEGHDNKFVDEDMMTDTRLKIQKVNPAFKEMLTAQHAYKNKKSYDPEKKLIKAIEEGKRLQIPKLPTKRRHVIEIDSEIDAKMTFDRFKLYLDTRMGFLSKTTRTIYMYNFNSYMKHRNEIKQVNDMDDMLEFEKEQMYINYYNEKKGKQVANGIMTMNPHYVNFLKHFYKAFKHINIRDVENNVGIIFPTPHKTSKDDMIKFLTIEEINELLRYLEDEDANLGMVVCVRMLFETGMRRQELNMIKKEEIDVLKQTIYAPGKGKRGRDIKGIYFSYKTRQYLEKWLKICPVEDYPFQLKADILAPDHYFWGRLKKIGMEVLGKKVSPHMMRHSLGVFLRTQVTKDLEVIRKALRHRSIMSTQIYITATDSEVKDTMKETFKRIDKSEF